ncbi:hypothetical protein BGW80DRAFT_1172618 [Lactifluus volemus]|nr:hypothetical protein BGW80DRAFT_1172618 [Lactifluus volemus]
MSRVKLTDISALTLYSGEPTLSRRGQPIRQLVCKGDACKLFTPDVIRCVNLGGEGTEVDWKCDTDLPEALRLGRVQVSCEGWSGPGDSYVLKGSCSLEYRLQKVPDALRPSASHINSPAGWSACTPFLETAALWLCFGILAFVLYKFLGPCFNERPRSAPPRIPRPPPSSSFGWFPGGHDDRRPGPPPPYSKHPPSTNNTAGPSESSGTRDGPGFWSGAALGSLGTYLFTRQRNPDPQPRPYDWERHFPRQRQSYRATSSSTSSQHQSSSSQRDNRGEGSSSLGPMMTSTGYGGSSVR